MGGQALGEESSEVVESPFLKIFNMQGPQQPDLTSKLIQL